MISVFMATFVGGTLVSTLGDKNIFRDTNIATKYFDFGLYYFLNKILNPLNVGCRFETFANTRQNYCVCDSITIISQ